MNEVLCALVCDEVENQDHLFLCIVLDFTEFLVRSS